MNVIKQLIAKPRQNLAGYIRSTLRSSTKPYGRPGCIDNIPSHQGMGQLEVIVIYAIYCLRACMVYTRIHVRSNYIIN